MQAWARRESYFHYKAEIPCTYSMTVNLELTELISSLKKKNLKFFPMILHCISTIVNRHQEFRMDLDEHGNLGYYTFCNPCYTVFHKETECCTNVWTEYSPHYETFMQNYFDDSNLYQMDSQKSKAIIDKNIFPISCIPWTSFTGFNLNLQKGYDYFLPIFTIGKYFSDKDKVLLPLAIQVHHAVCDGFHLARFINELQEEIYFRQNTL